MASEEHEPITGVWGQSPQRGPGAEPLVRGSGRRSPPEAESILAIECPTKPANLAPFQKISFRTSLHATKSLTTAESSMQSKRSLWTDYGFINNNDFIVVVDKSIIRP